MKHSWYSDVNGLQSVYYKHLMLQLIVDVIQSLPTLIQIETDTLLCPLSAHLVQIHILWISYKCHTHKKFKTGIH